jgi:PAS domain-containing protein
MGGDSAASGGFRESESAPSHGVGEEGRVHVLAQTRSEDLRTVLPQCEFPLLVWSPPEGDILLANEAAADLVDVPLRQLIGRVVFDFVAPRTAIERAAALLASGTADGLRSRRLLHRQTLGDVEVSIWSRPIELDGHNKVIALLVPEDELGKLGRDPATPWRDLAPIVVGIVADKWRIQ